MMPRGLLQLQLQALATSKSGGKPLLLQELRLSPNYLMGPKGVRYPFLNPSPGQERPGLGPCDAPFKPGLGQLHPNYMIHRKGV